MEEDDFYLKWEKHHNAFVSVFDSLYRHNVLVDCILTAEERIIKAHRIVLMACSPYFEELLSQHSDNFPIVFLDIKFSELEAIVDFCYRGEVKLPQNELRGFVKAANTLRIKGLCTTDLKSEKKKRMGGGSGAVLKRRKTSSGAVKMENESEVSESAIVPDIALSTEENGVICSRVESLTDGVICKMEITENPDQAEPSIPNYILNCISGCVKLETDQSSLNQGSDNSDVDSDDSDSNEEGENKPVYYLFPWTCNRCGEAFSTRNLYSEHRKSCVDTTNHPWTCHRCPNSYKNKKDLVRHLIYCGNDVARLKCDRCGSTYKYERGLRRHQKYCGTNTKPLECPQCNKTYKYKRGLRRHQRVCGIVFPKSSPTLVIKSEDPKEMESPEEYYGTFTVPWSCPCGKAYKYRRSYLKHTETCPERPHNPEEEEDVKPDIHLDSTTI